VTDSGASPGIRGHVPGNTGHVPGISPNSLESLNFIRHTRRLLRIGGGHASSEDSHEAVDLHPELTRYLHGIVIRSASTNPLNVHVNFSAAWLRFTCKGWV